LSHKTMPNQKVTSFWKVHTGPVKLPFGLLAGSTGSLTW